MPVAFPGRCPLVSLVVSGLLLAAVAAPAGASQQGPRRLEPGVRDRLAARYRIDTARLTETPSGLSGSFFLTGDLTPIVAAPAPTLERDPRAIARSFVEAEAAMLGAAEPGELVEASTRRDQFGQTHVAWHLRMGGVRVEGHEVLVHVGSAGRIGAVNGHGIPLPDDVRTAMTEALGQAQVAEDRARAIVVDDLAGRGLAAWRDIVSLEKVLVERSPWLIWKAEVPTASPPGRWIYRLDARTGAILSRENRVAHETATRAAGGMQQRLQGPASPGATPHADTEGPKIGTGTGVRGNQETHVDTFFQAQTGLYFMVDFTRRAGTDPHGHHGQLAADKLIQTAAYDGGGNLTDPWPDDDNAWIDALDAMPVDAHVNAARVYDFMLGSLQLNGPNGAGTFSMLNLANDASCQDNAFWNGQFVTYCVGDQIPVPLAGAADVAAHEWGHAVTTLVPQARRPDDLVYEKMSGALNEAFSDWLGAAFDGQRGASAYDLGEDVLQIRDLADPPRFQQPDRLLGQFWVDVENCTPAEDNDQCGVHTNSGVPNKMFYLLAEGGAFNGVTVTGIGLLPAMAIGLDANVNFWPSRATFADARDGMIQAATPRGQNAVNQVKNAWAAVGVGSPADPPAPTSCPGDVTGDGNRTVADITALRLHLVGREILTGQALANADYNGDGTADCTDVVRQRRCVATLETCRTCE